MTKQNSYPLSRSWEKGIVLDISSNFDDDYGFLPIQNMTETLKGNFLNITQGERIHARYLKPAYNVGEYPIFTQRGLFQIDEPYNLIIRLEEEDRIICEAPDNCLYPIKKIFWEHGPLYQPPKNGASIECRIIAISEEGYPFFERVSLSNPYFKHPKDIIKSKPIVQMFEDWLEYPDHDWKRQLRTYFDNQNPKYLFSMIKLLEKEFKEDLRRADYDRAQVIIEQTILLNRWILKGGYLSIQDDDFRTLTKNRLRDNISDLEDFLEVITVIQGGKTEKFLKDLSKESLSKSEKTDRLFGQLVKILPIMPTELVNSTLLEDSLRPIINDRRLFSGVYPYNILLIRIRDRKKILRKLLFQGQSISLVDPFHDMETLKHYLFLLDVEYNRSDLLENHLVASIDKATYMITQAMLGEDVESKSNQLNDALNYLDSKKSYASSFDSDSARIEWSHSKNILLARCYEYLANLEPSVPEKLPLLKSSIDHYKRGKDNRGYIISHYYDYYNFLQNFENESIISTLKKETEVLLSRIGESFYLNNKHPILGFFQDFYTVLSLMGQDELKSIRILTDFIEISSNQPSEFPEIGMLARQILANNVIIPIALNEYSYYESIKSYLIAKEISAPIYEEAATDSTALEDHIIFEEENQLLETKGSFFIDVNDLLYTKRSKDNHEIQSEACKTIAGMLNSEGGEFILGVLEADRYNDKKMRAALNEIDAVRISNRVIIGIEPDINHFKINIDRYIQRISDNLRTRICKDVTSFINILPELIEGRTILRINISPYPDEAGVAVDDTNFYIRENNQTMKYMPVDFFKIRQG